VFEAVDLSLPVSERLRDVVYLEDVFVSEH